MRLTYALLVPFMPLLLLTACAMQNQSFVSDEPIQINKEDVSHDMPANHVSRAALNYIADDVKRRATGDVDVAVHYQLKKPLKGTQAVANAQGARVKSYLQQQGVKQHIAVLLQPDKTDAPNTIAISYSALKAKGPANCMDISHADADRYDHGSDSGYFYGCDDDRYLSEMIARPGDLLGDDKTTAASSQRLGKSMETYNSGEPLTPATAQGVSASDVYSQ